MTWRTRERFYLISHVPTGSWQPRGGRGGAQYQHSDAANRGRGRGGAPAPGRGRGGGRGGHSYNNESLVQLNFDELVPVERRWALVDIGVNLAHKRFAKDRKAVIDNAIKVGVKTMIITGTSIKDTQEAREVALERPGTLYFTAGVHPHDAKSCGPTTIDQLRAFSKDPQCVAIGECGLDFDRDFSPRDVQEKWFEEQIKLAGETNKPLFLHERAAFVKFSAILERNKAHISKACVHCFTGTKEELDKYLELDCYIGITGWLNDERRGLDLQRIVSRVPLNRLMIETDAPFLTPRDLPVRGVSRNEPALLPFVLKKLAQCLKMSEGEVAKQTTATAREFFGLPAEDSTPPAAAATAASQPKNQ